MRDILFDPIIAEVRKNREELFAEFDYDITKLREHLDSLRPEIEAAGFHYETDEDRNKRIESSIKRREAEDRRIALLITETNTVAG